MNLTIRLMVTAVSINAAMKQRLDVAPLYVGDDFLWDVHSLIHNAASWNWMMKSERNLHPLTHAAKQLLEVDKGL